MTLNKDEMILFNNKGNIPNDKNNQYEELIKNRWIYPLNDGQYIYSSDFQQIMLMFDEIILSWAREDNAQEYLYPDLYKITDLDRCKYIEQFRNHCLFVTADEMSNIEARVKSKQYINNPAVCMHCYIQFKDSIVDSENFVTITAKGKCKRNESNGFTTLERLLDFTMREVVFIGTREFVLKKRQEYIERSILLMKKLNLCGNISLSNDPFYTKEGNVKAEFQRKFKLKYELNLINYDNNHSIAVGSFNYHNSNFSKAYNIRLSNGQLASTACVAFGLERLAYAYISQRGIMSCYQALNDYIRQECI